MIVTPDEYDNTAFIVGGGPSLKTFNWALLNDPKKFVVAINTAYINLPNANFLYFTDPPWATDHMENLKKYKPPIHQGALNLETPKPLDIVDEQWLLTGAIGLETKEGCLRHGSNSVFACTNLLAVHFKFTKIYLLGVDMKFGTPGNVVTSHWHSDSMPHKKIDAECVYRRMLDNWKTIKQPLLDIGVEVINVNTESGTALKEFPIKSFSEVFDGGT